jgi:hypothetical protein
MHFPGWNTLQISLFGFSLQNTGFSFPSTSVIFFSMSLRGPVRLDRNCRHLAHRITESTKGSKGEFCLDKSATTGFP